MEGFRVAYARKSSWRSSRPWISSASVVRNDPRSCRENLSRALVLGSRQEEPRGFRRKLGYVGGGEGGVGTPRAGGRGWMVVVLLGGSAGSSAFRGPGGLRRAAGGNTRERAEVFCPTRPRL